MQSKHLLFCLLFAAVFCTAQSRDSKAEALASCAISLEPIQLTPYGFAKAVLGSLWYARTAAERGNEIKQIGKETDNHFSWMTAMMRIDKASTNDFICAKKSLRPFLAKEAGEDTNTAAEALVMTYDQHIGINDRLLDVLKKLDNTKQVDLMDQISTLQVERGQRWSDLVQPTALALMLLIDQKHTDAKGNVDRLVVTKAQKQNLLDWANEHFPEFKNGTPNDQWSDPAKTAHLFFGLFEHKKCSDE